VAPLVTGQEVDSDLSLHTGDGTWLPSPTQRIRTDLTAAETLKMPTGSIATKQSGSLDLYVPPPPSPPGIDSTQQHGHHLHRGTPSPILAYFIAVVGNTQHGKGNSSSTTTARPTFHLLANNLGMGDIRPGSLQTNEFSVRQRNVGNSLVLITVGLRAEPVRRP
jgi:hypothetical protein